MDEKPKALRQRFLKFILTRWKTPDTYDSNYHKLVRRPGVYIITRIKSINEIHEEEIVYVGSSLNLYVRCNCHTVQRDIYSEESTWYSRLFFKEMDTGFFDFEVKLIRKLQPQYNKNRYGKGPGN